MYVELYNMEMTLINRFNAKNNNRGAANGWLLRDIDTNEISQFEQGLEFSNLKKTRTDILQVMMPQKMH